MENWLYFRTTSLANDNGIVGSTDVFSSICVPASRIVSIHPRSDTQLHITIKNTRIDDHHGGEDSAIENLDFIKLDTTAGKHEEVQKAIFEAITGGGRAGFVIIGDDATGEYIHPDLITVSDITSYAAPQGCGYHTMTTLQSIHNGADDKVVASLPFTLPSGSIIVEASMTPLSSTTLSDIAAASVNLKVHTAALADNASTDGTEVLGTEGLATCIPNDNLNIGSGDTANQIVHSGGASWVAIAIGTSATGHLHLNATEDMSGATDNEAFVVTTIKWYGEACTLLA